MTDSTCSGWGAIAYSMGRTRSGGRRRIRSARTPARYSDAGATTMKSRMAIPTLDEAFARRHRPAQPTRFGHRTPDYEALLGITDRIATRFRDPESFRELTRGEQIVYLLGFELDAELQNGGIDQYLWNSSGDNAEAARQHLREVGALDVLALLERVACVFAGGVIPADRDERQAALERAEEEGAALGELFDAVTREYHRCEDELYRRLVDFVEAHAQEFAAPDAAAVRRLNGG